MIRAATNRMDLAEINRLSKLAQRVQSIDAQIDSLRRELDQIAAIAAGTGDVLPKAESAPGNGSSFGDSSDDGEVVIEVDWSLCHVSRPPAKFSKRKVSATMAEFFAELHTALGADALRKLTEFRVSRGPLISLNPQADYVNKKTGAIYVNHPVGHTGFYVLTHSSTQEKISALKEAWRFLGLTPGALTVRRN